VGALVLFALAWIALVCTMYVNRFFSSIPRIQSERGHTVISTGPYRYVRHPGYTAALLGAVTSGIGLGSWISTFIAPIALALLVRRTIVEDRMLQRDLPGYADTMRPASATGWCPASGSANPSRHAPFPYCVSFLP
jgi:protein-S-isoprenylcysteine O-methyltransferase Ste14